MVRTTVEALAATGVTGRGLVTIICGAMARATKAATRTYRANGLGDVNGGCCSDDEGRC